MSAVGGAADMIRGDLLHPAKTIPLLVALTLLLLTTACGVAFHETFDGTEVFKSISLNGDRVPNSQLTLNLTVAQTYPVPVTVSCFYDNEDKLTDDDYRVAFQERATRIGEIVMPPATAPIERKL